MGSDSQHARMQERVRKTCGNTTSAPGTRRARGTGLLEEKTALLLLPKAACDLIKREIWLLFCLSNTLEVQRGAFLISWTQRTIVINSTCRNPALSRPHACKERARSIRLHHRKVGLVPRRINGRKTESARQIKPLAGLIHAHAHARARARTHMHR